MSVELISVLVAVLAMGVTLAGLILTSNRGLRKDMREDIGQLRGDIKDLRANCASAWRIWKGCWKDFARPSPDGSRPAKGRTWAHLYLNKLSKELEWTPELPENTGKRSYETHEDTRYTSGNHRVRVARCCSVRRNREELSPPAASRRRRGVAISLVGHEHFAVSEQLYLQRVRLSRLSWKWRTAFRR